METAENTETDPLNNGGNLSHKNEGSYYERALQNFFARRWHRNIATIVQKLMPRGYESMKHLDIGCADGISIRMIKPEGHITGVDVDPVMLKHAEERGIQVVQADARDMHMFSDNSFDLITCLDTLEHIEHPTLALAEACRVLNHRGFFIVTTPNVNIAFRFIWWIWTHAGMGEYWETCPHVHAYNLWNPTETGMSLIERFRDVGLKPERTMLTNWKMIAGVRAIKL